MRLLVLCLTILTFLLALAWCGTSLHETDSLSWDSIFAFLPSMAGLLIYVKMDSPEVAPEQTPLAPHIPQHDIDLFATTCIILSCYIDIFCRDA